MKIYAYYYPGFHDDDYRSCSEWALLNQHGYSFPQPLKELYDDSRKDTVLQQCNCAAQFGISGFIVDSYWRPDGSILMHHALASIRDASRKTPFEYSIMWVPRWPRKNLPIGNNYKNEVDRFFSFHRNVLSNMFLYYSSHLVEIGYMRYDGKPVLTIFHAKRLVDVLGFEQMNASIEDMQDVALSQIGSKVHLTGIINNMQEYLLLNDSAFDSLSSYVWLPDWNGVYIQKYREQVKFRLDNLENIFSNHLMPYIPSLSVGWDARPRAASISEYKRSFPWHPIVTENDPDKLSIALDQYYKYAYSEKCTSLYIASWNEWSEGHYLEPCSEYGYSRLLAVKSFLDRVR